MLHQATHCRLQAKGHRFTIQQVAGRAGKLPARPAFYWQTGQNFTVKHSLSYGVLATLRESCVL